MKAVFENIDTKTEVPFVFKKIVQTQFDSPFHFHPEYELTYIIKGEGRRYVGTKVQDFSSGDLVLLGSNVPHCWISNQNKQETEVSAFVIQFGIDFMGKGFFDRYQFKHLKELLQKSNAGLQFQLNNIDEFQNQIETLNSQNSFEKSLGILRVLNSLTMLNDVILLDNSYQILKNSNNETQRFQQVFAYLIDNFKENISLEQISAVANLSVTSFCRYFKTLTGKTFIEITNEYRINEACQLLENTNMPINEIAFLCGFSDVPYFNKTFKKQKNKSPLAYKKYKLLINKNL